ncbi:hypothetical protein ASAP_2230 [Asaia bogorensis]|uniref:Uncharacterized protein n=1 Tax=Asaia bogorensis TaxID=91915 RepID=A0A060QH75_9PROT|nr:hypothetical protein ASAP_2230 [Asaia bogorensis]
MRNIITPCDIVIAPQYGTSPARATRRQGRLPVLSATWIE